MSRSSQKQARPGTTKPERIVIQVRPKAGLTWHYKGYKDMSDIPRKRNRLPRSEYLGKKWYFVTICCHPRRAFFAEHESAGWFLQILRATSVQHEFAVSAYCVMPDHVHLLLYGMQPSSELIKFATQLKTLTGRAWWDKERCRLWQPRYYDHILRGKDGPHRVACYIWMNPVRKGLCRDPREYPLSGSLTGEWKAKASSEEGWLPPWKRKSDQVKPENWA